MFKDVLKTGDDSQCEKTNLSKIFYRISITLSFWAYSFEQSIKLLLNFKKVSCKYYKKLI